MWKAVYVLSLFGIGLALYLLYSYIFRPAYQPCSINSSVNCDAIIKGPVSTLFGVPTALYGLIGYTCILISTFTKNKKLLFAMSAFGLVFCLRITFIELFLIHVYCPICLACQLVMAVVFILSLFILSDGTMRFEKSEITAV